MKYAVRIFITIIFMSMIFSCEKQGTTPDENNIVRFKIQLASTHMPASVFRIQGELNRNGFDTLSAAFTIGDYYATADFGQVFAGEWQLSVSAFDTNNTRIYYGETPVNILPNQDNIVHLHLDPVTGTLLVNVTWGYDLTNGLLAYYPFNGNANDESGNGLHGTPQNVELTTDRFGNPNSAYYFYTYFSAIDLGDVLNDLEMPFTLSTWVRPNTHSGPYGIFHSDRHEDFSDVYDYHGTSFYFTNKDASDVTRDSLILGVRIADGGGNDPVNRRNKVAASFMPLDEWTLVTAVIIDPNHMHLYINGEEIEGNYTGYASSMAHNEWHAWIGTKFQGDIDEFRIYNRALTASEVLQIFNEEFRK